MAVVDPEYDYIADVISDSLFEASMFEVKKMIRWNNLEEYLNTLPDNVEVMTICPGEGPAYARVVLKHPERKPPEPEKKTRFGLGG